MNSQGPTSFAVRMNMKSVYVLLLLAVSVQGIVVSHRQRFPNGRYCVDRQPLQCCPDRDDTCTMPIKDTVCYCDHFCAIHHSEDCCPDYEDVCIGGVKTTTPESLQPRNECIHNDRLYQPDQSVKRDCRTCTCKSMQVQSGSVYTWQCENIGCINEQILVNRVNQGNYGWRAGTYDKFNGDSLSDGLSYYLGTNNPKEAVIRMNPIKIEPDERFATEFDSRVKWPHDIHPAMDQGKCAASWAFSTAGVAADRWGIQSKGKFREHMSVQSMISCSDLGGCDGARVIDGWFFLRRQGAVADECYPYTSGTTKTKGRCKSIDEMTCFNNHVHKTTPAYRIANDERQIMKEIEKEGPVQAIITVHPDFYLYQGGIYQHTKEELRISEHDHTLSDTHSVKIIGWGEDENGVKFWRCTNSWGQQWGEDGTFRIRRGVNEIGVEEFIVGVLAQVTEHDLKDRRLRRHRHK